MDNDAWINELLNKKPANGFLEAAAIGRNLIEKIKAYQKKWENK